MVRVSNVVIIVLNVLTFAAALITIGFSVWFLLHQGSLCQKVLHRPLLFLGLALLVVSVLGLIGSCYRNSFFLWVYLALLFLLILGLICYTVFTIIVTNKGVGKALSNRGVEDHRLGDYSRWLQRYVVNEKNWNDIKSCLVDVQFCQRIDTAESPQIYQQSLSIIQSGCCMPPLPCGFQSTNATFWIMPKSGPAVPDEDCKSWSNDQNKLCLDCQSCKAAVLNNLKREWKTLAIINICVLVLVIFVYCVGCCALRSNQAKGYSKYKRGNP